MDPRKLVHELQLRFRVSRPLIGVLRGLYYLEYCAHCRCWTPGPQRELKIAMEQHLCVKGKSTRLRVLRRPSSSSSTCTSIYAVFKSRYNLGRPVEGRVGTQQEILSTSSARSVIWDDVAPLRKGKDSSSSRSSSSWVLFHSLEEQDGRSIRRRANLL